MRRAATVRHFVVVVAMVLVSSTQLLGALPTRAAKADRPPAAAPPVTPSSAAPTSPGVLAIDLADYGGCAIRAQGTLACWGDDTYDQASPPPGSYRDVATGTRHSCAIKSDRTLTCWGGDGENPDPPPSGTWAAIDAALRYTCAISTAGALDCWGSDYYGQASPPPGTFTAVSTAERYGCAVRTDASVVCWGDDGGTGVLSYPTTGAYQDVAVGRFHACAVKTDGTATCWGSGTPEELTTSLDDLVSIEAGWGFTCGIRTTGALACWGRDDSDQSSPPSGKVLALTATEGAACAIGIDGWTRCWGHGTGNIQLPPGFTPSISAGWYHTCALRSDGTIQCWGDDEAGVSTPPPGAFTMVSAGQAYSCAVSMTGALSCWGDDREGLGLLPGGTFRSVSVGGNHACAIRSDRSLTCWGFNADGQASPPPGEYRAVSAGFRHTCAILITGERACWGSDEAGQVGSQTGSAGSIAAGGWHTCSEWGGGVTCWGYDGDDQASAPAFAVAELTAGFEHTCGQRGDGTIHCWGYGGDGQTSPPGGSFAAVSAGGWHGCAVKASGAPTCWGWNYYNQAMPVAPAATTYVPIAPVRLLDSRSGNGLSGRFKANVARTFQITGRAGIPANAVAVTGNLTVVGQSKAGYASLTPTATNAPRTSTINFPLHDTRANNVTGSLGSGGKVSAVFKAPSGATTDLLLDVTGFFVPTETGATYGSVGPVRLLDTRSGNGLSGAFQANTPRTWSVAGRSSVPAAAIAVTGNLTVTGQTAGGYVSLGPVATATPATSTINFPLGDTRANGTTVKLSPTGTLSAVYKGPAGSRAHLLFDVTGYYLADLSGARFYPLRPDRLLDTRLDIGLEGAMVAATPRALETAARVGVADDATAVTGNLTVVGQTKGGYVSMTTVPTASPTTSTLNFPVGDVRANGVTGPLAGNGTVGLVYVSSSGAKSGLLLDITGYFR